MKTFKYVLRHRQNSDGTHTIQLRVTENRKPIYYTTPYRIYKSFWNKNGGYPIPSYKNSVELNSKLKLFQELHNKVDLPKGDFLEFWESYIEKIKAEGSIGSAYKHLSSIKVFKEYMGDVVNFSDINKERMTGYLHFLKIKYKNHNTLLSYLKKLRRIITLAIEEDLHICSSSYRMWLG